MAWNVRAGYGRAGWASGKRKGAVGELRPAGGARVPYSQEGTKSTKDTKNWFVIVQQRLFVLFVSFVPSW